ncbi:hypothetical protein VNO77_42676 [Canavalia gladiata]|uniref:GH18 domain-containing protein n=1 Tax=Canavalia gladiata TaxID=3824 RepID=A0AAN9PPB7_CANGL
MVSKIAIVLVLQGFSVSDINSSLYTHLICVFAQLNSSSYEISVSPADEQYFSSFTSILKQKNPSISTLLSIGGGTANYTVFSSMVTNASTRKSFIQSSIRIARLYGSQGHDFSWVSSNTSSDMSNMGRLFEEWREAAKSEATSANSRTQELILIAAVHDVASQKLVLGLPFYGYAWNLRSPKKNAIGAATTAPSITQGGDMSYKDIKAYVQHYGASVLYIATYVVNYFSFGSTWIGKVNYQSKDSYWSNGNVDSLELFHGIAPDLQAFCFDDMIWS